MRVDGSNPNEPVTPAESGATTPVETVSQVTIENSRSLENEYDLQLNPNRVSEHPVGKFEKQTTIAIAILDLEGNSTTESKVIDGVDQAFDDLEDYKKQLEEKAEEAEASLEEVEVFPVELEEVPELPVELPLESNEEKSAAEASPEHNSFKENSYQTDMLLPDGTIILNDYFFEANVNELQDRLENFTDELCAIESKITDAQAEIDLTDEEIEELLELLQDIILDADQALNRIKQLVLKKEIELDNQDDAVVDEAAIEQEFQEDLREIAREFYNAVSTYSGINISAIKGNSDWAVTSRKNSE